MALFPSPQLYPTMGEGEIRHQHFLLPMHRTVRNWIVNALEERKPLIELAVRQRAKFEGWLKFELAYQAKLAGVSEIEVESGSTTANGNVRADVSFRANNIEYCVELKTPNTNWRIPGVEDRTRPITKNIASIVADGRKLKLMSQQCSGIVAFVLFPVPVRDQRWLKYLSQISTELSVHISEQEHTSQVIVPLHGAPAEASLVVCAFTVSHGD